jgi:hypothetical protein
MLTSRREFMQLLALSGASSAASLGCAADAGGELTPEMFGARGDGTTPDGEAFARLIAAVNARPGSDVCVVRCSKRYVITGGPRQTSSYNKAMVAGIVEGIPPVTRDNVHVEARGAEFIVDPAFMWRRTTKGGDGQDHFAVGWQFYGARCRLSGGRMIGNLQNRQVVRGPESSGFGGSEYGLVMVGAGWELDGVHAENWGTDCLMIGGIGSSSNGTYTGARRNCVSVVPIVDFGPGGYVTIAGGRIAGGGKWPEEIRNNPGAGIDVEGLNNELPATVRIRGVAFDANENKDLQISTNAVNCVVEDCTFTNNVKFQTKQKGGHLFRNNRFKGEARVETMFGLASNPPITFDGNSFEVRSYPPFRQNVIKSIDRGAQGQKVVFVNNRAPNWRGRFSDMALFRDGSVFENNQSGLD